MGGCSFRVPESGRIIGRNLLLPGLSSHDQWWANFLKRNPPIFSSLYTFAARWHKP